MTLKRKSPGSAEGEYSWRRNYWVQVAIQGGSRSRAAPFHRRRFAIRYNAVLFSNRPIENTTLTKKLISITTLLVPALVLSASVSSLASESKKVELAVTARPDKAGLYDLHIQLKNCGAEDIKMFRASLPWGNSRSVYLNAVRNRTPLIAPTPIDDPAAGDVTIKPGETVEGYINLHERFPSLEKELSNDDVDLLWTYQASQTTGSTMSRFGGWVLLPKKTKY